MTLSEAPVKAEPVHILCADGFPLGGTLHRSAEGTSVRGAVLLSSATGVWARLDASAALTWLAERDHGPLFLAATAWAASSWVSPAVASGCTPSSA